MNERSISDRGSKREPSISSGGALIALAVAGCTAIVCARGIDQACHDAEPPVAIPTPGTPRADYCGGLEHLPFLPTLIVVPLLMTGLALLACRRRPLLVVVLVGLIVAATLANLILVISLKHSLTI
jgi:hypothetical protein